MFVMFFCLYVTCIPYLQKIWYDLLLELSTV